MFRRRRSSDTWHFCTNCSNWPRNDYVEQIRKPTWGEYCNECLSKRTLELVGPSSGTERASPLALSVLSLARPAQRLEIPEELTAVGTGTSSPSAVRSRPPSASPAAFSRSSCSLSSLGVLGGMW